MLQVSLGRTEALLTSTGPLVEPAHAENARGQFSQEEGKARAEITQFNRFCGRLDRQMRLVTKERDGVERGLTPVNPNVIAPQQGAVQTVVAPAQTASPSRTILPLPAEAPVERAAPEEDTAVISGPDARTSAIFDVMGELGIARTEGRPQNIREVYMALKVAIVDSGRAVLAIGKLNEGRAINSDELQSVNRTIELLLRGGNLSPEQRGALERVQSALQMGQVPDQADLVIVSGLVTSFEARLKEKEGRLLESLPEDERAELLAQASLGEVSFENEGTEFASLLPNREETGNVDNTSESFDIMMQGLEAYFGEALAQNEALLSQADNLSGICDDVQNEALVNA